MIRFSKTDWPNKLGGVVFAFSALSLIGAICAAVYAFFFDASMYYGWAGALVALSSVLVAFGANLLVQGKNLSDEKEKRSRYHLDSCVLAYEEAMQVLGNGTNDRADWVRASRLLLYAKNLEESIEKKSHILVLEIHQLKYRHFFAEILRKHGVHFYGMSSDVIEKNRELNGKEMMDYAYELSRNKYNPDVRPLQEDVLYVVWQAAQFPASSKVPFEPIKFSEEERNALRFEGRDFSGLAEYLEHRERKREQEGEEEN